ncbi:MAG: hypothetical protein ACLPXM_10125 [Terriglobales bacterium]
MHPHTIWTVQQFTTIAGHPWFALQQHNDAGILCQFTGYRHEIDALIARLAIVPEELSPLAEEDFFARCQSEP